jgi:general secretion pathway protein G
MRDTTTIKCGGLTFIELTLSVTLMAIIIVTAMPLADNIATRAREQELKESLIEMRAAIDRFYASAHKKNPDAADAEKYPRSLEELVSAHFLRRIPLDPMTGKDGWRTISSTDVSDTLVTNNQNIFDVRSRSLGTGSNGVAYYEW